MSFDQSHLNHWMVQTIQFANVCRGTDESTTESIHATIHQVVAGLPARPSIKQVMTAFLLKAQEISGPEHIVPNEDLEERYQDNVMRWTLKTIEGVWTTKGIPTMLEQLEHEAEQKIVGHIQHIREEKHYCNGLGGPVVANRNDLDVIVRRTIEWGLDALGVSPVATR